jgi:hypothetical protein
VLLGRGFDATRLVIGPGAPRGPRVCRIEFMAIAAAEARVIVGALLNWAHEQPHR